MIDLYDHVMGVASGTTTKADIAVCFAKHLRALD
jgi:hypothetical protein